MLLSGDEILLAACDLLAFDSTKDDSKRSRSCMVSKVKEGSCSRRRRRVLVLCDTGDARDERSEVQWPMLKGAVEKGRAS